MRFVGNASIPQVAVVAQAIDLIGCSGSSYGQDKEMHAVVSRAFS